MINRVIRPEMGSSENQLKYNFMKSQCTLSCGSKYACTFILKSPCLEVMPMKQKHSSNLSIICTQSEIDDSDLACGKSDL